MAVHRPSTPARRNPGGDLILRRRLNLRWSSPAGLALVLGVVTSAVVALVMLPGSVGPAGAQGPDDTVTTTVPVDPAVPTTAVTSAVPTSAVRTTSPLPPDQQPLPVETTIPEKLSKGGELNNILPRPNSGHEPYYQGDRGTGSQYAVLGFMLLALIVIIALVVRQSRRSRALWNAAAPMATLPPRPQNDPATPGDVSASAPPLPDPPTSNPFAPEDPVPEDPAPEDPAPGSDAS